MKKILYFAALALMLSVAACKNNGYKITGTVAGGEDGDTVILADVQSMFEIDTVMTTTIKGGEFVFEGVQDTAAMRYIIWKSNSNPELAQGTIIALENADITVAMDTVANKPSEISGTPANEALTALNKKEGEINKKAESVFAVLNDTTASEESRAKAEADLNKMQEEMMDCYKSFIKENITNVAGVTYLAQYASMLDDTEVVEYISLIPENLMNESVRNLKEIYDVKAQTAVGQDFKDIKAKTPEGGEMSVSECAANAKVLMIDFWASWCGPCRAEMPNVKAAYEQFHAQGFDIIGVSLDQDEAAWKQAIADLGMAWPQISDLKGWECEGAALYGVRSIPATVLIKDGKIVARDVRGEKLSEKIAELLK